MREWRIVLAMGALCLVTVAVAGAGPQESAEGMPPMGPPPEMKMLEGMNGEYAVKFYFKMDPMSPDWTETDATAVISTVVGGGAQQLVFDGNMMGMPFSGIGLTSYDRETSQWQTTWVDSMGARISMYTGTFEDGELTVSGEDLNMGNTIHSRLTTYNITEEGWDWKYELSMDGENFLEGAKATYKRK